MCDNCQSYFDSFGRCSPVQYCSHFADVPGVKVNTLNGDTGHFTYSCVVNVPKIMTRIVGVRSGIRVMWKQEDIREER